MDNNVTSFDRAVGRITGAIYGDLSSKFPHPPLLLIPPLTFKVRKALEGAGDIQALTPDRKKELAKEIEVSIVPVLFSLELPAETVRGMAPLIEAAALKALEEPV